MAGRSGAAWGGQSIRTPSASIHARSGAAAPPPSIPSVAEEEASRDHPAYRQQELLVLVAATVGTAARAGHRLRRADAPVYPGLELGGLPHVLAERPRAVPARRRHGGVGFAGHCRI